MFWVIEKMERFSSEQAYEDKLAHREDRCQGGSGWMSLSGVSSRTVRVRCSVLLSTAAGEMDLGLATTLRASVRKHLDVAARQTIGHPTGNKSSLYAQCPQRSGAVSPSVRSSV